MKHSVKLGKSINITTDIGKNIEVGKIRSKDVRMVGEGFITQPLKLH